MVVVFVSWAGCVLAPMVSTTWSRYVTTAMLVPLVALKGASEPVVAPSVSSTVPLEDGVPFRKPVAVFGRIAPAPFVTHRSGPPAGSSKPAGMTSEILTSKAPSSPEPVFSTTMAKRTRSSRSMPDTLASGAPLTMLLELTVPLWVGHVPVVVTGLNVTLVGYRPALKPAAGLCVDAVTAPLRMFRTGSVSSIWMIAGAVNGVLKLFFSDASTWLVRKRPSRNGSLEISSVKSSSMSRERLSATSRVP